MSEQERMDELLENVRLLNAALLDLVDENDWDLDTALRTIGAWLTTAFNSELLSERVFRKFIELLIASFEQGKGGHG